VENAALRSVITAVFDLGPQARQLLSPLIAEIDRPAPMMEARTDNVPASRPSPATVERKARKARAKARQAAAAANGEAEANGWPALRQEVHARIADRQLNYRAVANEIECQQGTLRTWLSRGSIAPSERAQARLRQWLERQPAAPAGAAPAEDSLPPFRLTGPERDRLNGHLSLSGEGELREQFGMTKPALEKAAAGARLDAEIVTRVRTALVGSGAAAE
jgi:hypothetical protein